MRSLFLILVLSSALSACGKQSSQEKSTPDTTEQAAVSQTVQHDTDAENGRLLFVDKGCVVCHSVNGVGGKAAPALDAPIGEPAIDPLEFAARMWRGAPAMIELQSVELGYTIYLEADDIADLAAFAANREAQEKLTESDLPETIKNGLLDERFWEMEDWDDFLKSGREAPEDAELLDGEEPQDDL